MGSDDVTALDGIAVPGSVSDDSHREAATSSEPLMEEQEMPPQKRNPGGLEVRRREDRRPDLDVSPLLPSKVGRSAVGS